MGEWVNIYFDNTYWNQYLSSTRWTGTEWYSQGWEIYLRPIGTWADTFYPTKVKMIHDGSGIGFNVATTGGSLDTYPYTSGTEINLSQGGSDTVTLLNLYGGDFHCTAIWFYVEGGHLTVKNCSFETGDFSFWNVTGSGTALILENRTVTTVTPAITFYPTAGDYFAYIKADMSISQAVSWAAGDALHFDWCFNARDAMPYNDWAEFQIKNDAGEIIFQDVLSNVESVGDYGVTGWQHYTHTFETSGSGSIWFCSFNAIDNAIGSDLFIDNVCPPVVVRVNQPHIWVCM